jgi:hypothetical protein
MLNIFPLHFFTAEFKNKFYAQNRWKEEPMVIEIKRAGCWTAGVIKIQAQLAQGAQTRENHELMKKGLY